MNLPIDIRILIYVLVLAIVVLVGYLIYFFKKISVLLDDTVNSIDKLSKDVHDTLNSIDTDISDLKKRVDVSLDGIDELTGNLVDVTKNLNQGVQRTFNVIEPVENLVNDVVGKVQPPIHQLATFVSASSKAVNTFLDFLGRKKNKRKPV